ncbi:MAG: F0F1 ATP synthase subunit A [Patescibacteria group bacterium]|nr:F0F1 ATP synthase subunit A [Patescibacteria group bacterium]
MEHISLTSNIIFHIFGWPITNSILATWVAMLILVIIALMVRVSLKKNPQGVQNLMEMIVESLLNLVDSVTGDRQKSLKIFPWMATFFLFILVNNWIELIPGFSLIGLERHGEFIPLLRPANTDLNTTLALALISIIAAQFLGIIAIGLFQHLKKYFNFKNPINLFVGFLEILSEISRIISFAFRLFGNIFAGEVLLVVIAFLIPYIVPMPFYGLELFVGFIQALVFAMLTLVFMTMAMTSHDEAH